MDKIVLITPDEILEDSAYDIQMIIHKINAQIQRFNIDNGWPMIHINLNSPGNQHLDDAWRRWHTAIVEEYRKVGWVVKSHSDNPGVYFFEFNPDDVNNIMQQLIEKPLS